MRAVPHPLADRSPAGWLTEGDPDRAALIAGPRTVTRGELGQLVADRLCELDLPTRSVVVLAGETSLEGTITYLALLQGGHVPLLAGAHHEAIAERWEAAAVVTADRDGWRVDRRHDRDVALHDDLALLLPTSGSTGAPKLVRLSCDNLRANAASIVQFLDLGTDDVGITSLPLHYCYGLSVLHSHLLAGASLVLTGASVVDPCFAGAMRDHGVTNLAGVPHTFDLLERAGPERIAVPSLRLLTQAGGRMAPDRIVRWARRAEAWGARWFTMYGQTEATARIAYVPPTRVLDAPGAIGVAVPGGELSLRFDDETRAVGRDVGELIYRGPNVMLGYATEAGDLARGREVTELATGDLARRCDRSGMFTVVGRRSRFVKPFGVRVDLDDLERRVLDRLDGIVRTVDGEARTDDVGQIVVAGDDDGIVVVAPRAWHEPVSTAVRSTLAMPDHAWRVVDVAVPRTASGKVAVADVLRAARSLPGDTATHRSLHGRAPDPSHALDAPDARYGFEPPDDRRGHDIDRADLVADVFRAVLGRQQVCGDDTFVSLGGDSLSYVECSIRLEAVLGTLPDDWHLVRVDDFPAPRRRRLMRRIDTSVLLRAVGILAVVATHMGIVFFPGGAHLMLGVVGYNVSRFLLDVEPTRDRVRAAARAVARIAVPTVAWTLAGMTLFGAYSVGTALLVNNYVGPSSHADDHWHFWFVEVLVHLTVLAVALTSIPAVRSFDRRHRYLTPLGLLGVAVVLRMEWAWMGDWYNLRFRTHGIAFFFVLGWLVHRSTSWRTKAATTVICAAVVPGFFDRPQREWFIVGGLVLLTWFGRVALPGLLLRPVALVAAASMWIYLSHFTIWPALDAVMERELAYPLTVAAGVLVWAVARWIEPALMRSGRRVTERMAGRVAQRDQAATASP